MSNTQTTTEENERYNTLLLGIGKLINHGLEAHTYPATIASIDTIATDVEAVYSALLAYGSYRRDQGLPVLAMRQVGYNIKAIASIRHRITTTIGDTK
tara:strand:+ start:196 stop:489 length:294 start_codon:yes stop_codon:yes gene_type:complete